ncbi:EVE domain-containing protein [Xenorhabdus griffiniae]|uniref:EVE domain-containing protein n=2 Tax=Xenorhabdus TaxID=626 RepID=UPI00235937DA|nr:EVE domain-containing protein [Xenorhabdus griffiniae]MDC9606277.1 EVE domain-containing protein [Xenorhabdus griffiniae]
MMTKYWCGVVSREHIKFGEQGGFCQVCHGKRSPLTRMAVGDGIVFYSPVLQFQGKEKCQSFTAIGTVIGEETYQFQMTPTFVPYRRDIAYQPCVDAPIHPLLDQLSFTAGHSNWGYKFRFGHFEITAADFLLIEQAMLPNRTPTVLRPVKQESTGQTLDLFTDHS